MTGVRVLIIADDPLARAGLATLLADLPGVVVAGRVSGADDLPAAFETCRPDVLLWDLGWKPEAALSRLTEGRRTLPVVALAEDERDARQAWLSRVEGLLRRDAPPERIGAAVAAAAQGLLVVDDSFRPALGGSEAAPSFAGSFPADEPPLLEELTPRELEVLALVAKGLPNKTIAQRLDISEHTVKFHVNALLGKLGVSSRTEAVVRATRLGLIFL